MKLFSLLAGSVLLLVSVGGIVYWVIGFEMLKEILVEGVPVFFEHAGRQWDFPGRLVGTVALLIPIVCAIGGVSLLRLGFDRK